MKELIVEPKRDCGKMICKKCETMTPHQLYQTNRNNVFVCKICGLEHEVALNPRAQAIIEKEIERGLYTLGER